jgi:hypothetical protein
MIFRIIEVSNIEGEIDKSITLFQFSTREFYDAFNMVSGGMNTIILFFWVNNKLSDSNVRKHSIMTRLSFGGVTTYYTIFILITYFPRGLPVDFMTKFLLYPFYRKNSKMAHDYFYWAQNTEIIINIINQLVMLNFYFIVIKSTIIRPKYSKYLSRRKYYLINQI